VATGNGGVRVFSLRAPHAPPRNVPVVQAAFALAYTPDGRLLLEGDNAGDVEEYDAATLAPAGILHGDGSSVFELAVTPDGSTLAVVDAAGEVQLWSLASSEQLGPAVTTGSTTFAAQFDSTGSLLATSDQAGTIVLWPQILWDGTLHGFESDLCPRVGRNLTEVEWRQYLPGQPYQAVCAPK
jgi:WD40 repeat protein